MRSAIEGRNSRTKELLQRYKRQRTWGAEGLAVDTVITSLDQMVRAQHRHDARRADGTGPTTPTKPKPRKRMIEKAEYERREAEKSRRRLPRPPTGATT